MAYHFDLKAIGLEEYKIRLQKAYLPPSRRLLKEQLNERFAHFEHIGIKNVYELQLVLKKKDQLADLAKKDSLSENYLKILLREINSMHPKPNKLSDFTSISTEVIETLEKQGLKNTKKIFDYVKTPTDRNQLANTTGIDEAVILELAQLTDLSRIKWAGAAFAQMLYALGIDSAKKVAGSKPEELYRQINQLNES